MEESETTIETRNLAQPCIVDQWKPVCAIRAQRIAFGVIALTYIEACV